MPGKEFRPSGTFRRRGPGSAAKKKKAKPTSIKNQIRGVQRFLAKEGVDPRARQKQEERLQELFHAKQQHEKAERERKYAKRYHKVRFFERVKLERQLQKLEKQAAPLGPKEQTRLEQLRKDLQYVLHFPKGEKYVSLLKDAPESEDQARLEAERTRLRVLVRQQLAEAALMAEADEGRSLAHPIAAAGGSRARAAGGHGSDIESDGEEGGNVDEDDDFFLHSDASGSEDDEEQQQQQEEGWQQGRPSNGSGVECGEREGSEDDGQEVGREKIDSLDSEPEEQEREGEEAGTASDEDDDDDFLQSDSDEKGAVAAGPGSIGRRQQQAGGHPKAPKMAVVAVAKSRSTVNNGRHQQKQQQQWGQRGSSTHKGPGSDRPKQHQRQGQPRVVQHPTDGDRQGSGAAKRQPEQQQGGKGTGVAKKRGQPAAAAAEKQPLRKRAEGGRKRRKK